MIFRLLNFKSSYPIIPSRRSEISRFLADTDKIMQNIKGIDFQGISIQLKNTTKAIETFLAGDRTNRIMSNLESMSVKLDKSVAQINKIIAEGKIEGVFKETSETLLNARQLINSTKKEIEALNLAQQTAKTGVILDTWIKEPSPLPLICRTRRKISGPHRNIYRNLSESLNNNPSELIFSRPAPPRKPYGITRRNKMETFSLFTKRDPGEFPGTVCFFSFVLLLFPAVSAPESRKLRWKII